MDRNQAKTRIPREISALEDLIVALSHQVAQIASELAATKNELTANRDELAATRNESTSSKNELAATKSGMEALKTEMTATVQTQLSNLPNMWHQQPYSKQSHLLLFDEVLLARHRV